MRLRVRGMISYIQLTNYMDEFVKMDLFFFITTICVLLITFSMILIMYKLWRILGHVERIAAAAGAEAENLREDVAYVRGRLMGVLDTVFGFIPRSRSRKSKE